MKWASIKTKLVRIETKHAWFKMKAALNHGKRAL